MRTMIEVEGLTKYYGPVLAVDHISFAVPEGKIVGFLGPNGAGKSTTLKILTCFLSASGGRAAVAGFSVFHQSMEVRRRIGYLPENVPLYPDMRVHEYLRFRAQLKRIPAASRTAVIEQAADRCWLRQPMNVMHRRIDQLSKGYRQRLGLADAIMHEPDVLVLDEPTIGLDPAQIREMRNLIHELGQQHTIILSSHNLAEVEQTCQEIIIIAAGRIVSTGTPTALREQVSGGSRLTVEIKGAEADGVARAIAKVPGVRQAVVTERGAWSRLAVTPAEGQDPRTDIMKAVVANGWQLRELRREVGSLEDFFVQVTARQQLREKATA